MDDEVYEPKSVSYTGEDAAQMFVEMLIEDIDEIANIRSKEMDDLTLEQQHQYDNATSCWICNKEFSEDDGKKNYKERDHGHFTGKFREAAHNLCYLKYRKPNFTPVVFHNLSGYDSHLFVKNLSCSEGNIDCIPNNEERYISFTKTYGLGVILRK